MCWTGAIRPGARSPGVRRAAAQGGRGRATTAWTGQRHVCHAAPATAGGAMPSSRRLAGGAGYREVNWQRGRMLLREVRDGRQRELSEGCRPVEQNRLWATRCMGEHGAGRLHAIERLGLQQRSPGLALLTNSRLTTHHRPHAAPLQGSTTIRQRGDARPLAAAAGRREAAEIKAGGRVAAQMA